MNIAFQQSLGLYFCKKRYGVLKTKKTYISVSLFAPPLGLSSTGDPQINPEVSGL